MSVHHKHSWCLWLPEEDIRSPGTVITNKLPYAFWEKQPVLLIDELFFQSWFWVFETESDLAQVSLQLTEDSCELLISYHFLGASITDVH